MTVRNQDIYEFADSQIEHKAEKQIPRDKWIKWLEEKVYTQEEVDRLTGESYSMGFQDGQDEDD